MNFKTFEGGLIARLGGLLISLSLPAVVLVRGWPELLVFLAPLIIWQVYELIRFMRRSREDLNQFVEAIQYRDFSRFFDEAHASGDLQALKKGFNEINATFKTINQEKEAQHQYLQQVLELVGTGIMSFDLDSQEVLLMNESLKKLLQVPYLKNLAALAKRDPELYAAVVALGAGETRLVTARTTQAGEDTCQVWLSATAFQSQGRRFRLVAFQNVNQVLDETESKAWQKLLNVMTHEIMNSIAPIASLADTLKSRVQEATSGSGAVDLEELGLGISTIRQRSGGLLRFAETYRNLSKITKLNRTTVAVAELFGNLQRLLQPMLAQKKIRLVIQVAEPALSLEADPNLLDQVLINLMMNAVEAVKDQPAPEIILSAQRLPEGKVQIRMADNGPGMAPEVLEKIFIPFFSTKKKASGIGLSLCKQIVLLHRGTIQVQSVVGVGTAFVLRL